MDMIIKNVKHLKLNVNIMIAVLNTQALMMIYTIQMLVWQ